MSPDPRTQDRSSARAERATGWSSDPGLVTETQRLVAAALIAALMSVSSWLSFSIGTVPVTMQVFVVVLAALLLEPFWALASMWVYVLLGVAGVPVFAGGQAGIGVILGPLGGYILAFGFAALAGSYVRRFAARVLPVGVSDAIAAFAAIVLIYLVGTAWLGVVLDLSASKAIAAGLLPFIVPDLLKAAAATSVAIAVRKASGLAIRR